MSNEQDRSPFIMNIRGDCLECEVTVCAGFDPGSTGESLCIEELRGKGIEVTQDVAKRVNALLTLHETQTDQAHSLVVALGQEPEHGKDGWIEYLPKFDPDPEPGGSGEFTDSTGGLVAEENGGEGGMDFHDCSAFALAEVGEQIGMLHAPTPAVDGWNIIGETLPARLGKPAIPNVDDSVVVRESGIIESMTSGIVRIIGRKIRVLQKLDIDCNVDFSTGNIDFPGDVSVAKSIKDGFQVQASRDVLIRGLVEAATLSAGRDLHLLGGAACREKGTLEAQRDITARYLNECDLKAGRNLIVDKEIIHANIEVGVDLISPNCTLIGGTSFITGACDVAEIGSERNIPTHLTLGKARDADHLSDQAEMLLKSIGDRLHTSQTQHEQLVKHTTKRTLAQTEQMSELEDKIGAYSKLEEQLMGAVDVLNQAVDGVARVSLTVQKQIWRGVTIVLGDWEATLEEPIKGPLRITCNSAGKPILTDLISDSSVELSTVARVRSRIEDEGADESIAA
jgi:uncharacterized protein (DUF342 family)